jgi:hypothetical protein
MERLIKLLPNGGGQLLSELREGRLKRLSNLVLQHPP